MKQTYFAPATDIVTIATASAMLTGSVDAKIEGEQGNEDALGRETLPHGRSLWDDDED